MYTEGSFYILGGSIVSDGEDKSGEVEISRSGKGNEFVEGVDSKSTVT